MKETLKIRKTQTGYCYYLTSSTNLDCYGEIAKRMDGTIGLTRTGNWSLGKDWVKAGYTEEDIKKEIMAVMADGKERTVVLSREDKVRGIRRENDPCPICHTYCDGDCQTR